MFSAHRGDVLSSNDSTPLDRIDFSRTLASDLARPRGPRYDDRDGVVFIPCPLSPDPVAQLAEQRTFNPLVLGSSPSGVTKENPETTRKRRVAALMPPPLHRLLPQLLPQNFQTTPFRPPSTSLRLLAPRPGPGTGGRRWSWSVPGVHRIHLGFELPGSLLSSSIGDGGGATGGVTEVAASTSRRIGVSGPW